MAKTFNRHALKGAVKEQKSKQSSASPEQVIISQKEGAYFGLRSTNSSQLERPYVTLRYFDTSFECFSCWEKDELASFGEFLRKLSQMTWVQIQASGGKGGAKTGLGCTIHKDINCLPDHVIKGLSEDLNYMEMRVTQKARVHGFRMRDAFFLLCLDREHKIYKE